MSKGKILIGFAWLMEIVGVFGGVVNSAYTTFGDDLPHSIAGYVPVVPMFALAVAELVVCRLRQSYSTNTRLCSASQF